MTAQRTDEHVRQMIEQIKVKLKMATGAALKTEHYHAEHYDDVKDIYDLVQSKDSFSINEMEAIVSELGKLRNH